MAIGRDSQTGQWVDQRTGQTLSPTDPRIAAAQQEYAQVNAENASIPAGFHTVYPGGGDPTRPGYVPPHLEANQSGFDPALFGAELVGGPLIGLMNNVATGNWSPLSLALTAASFAGGANPLNGGVVSQAINSGAPALSSLGTVGRSVGTGIGTKMAGNSILNALFAQGGQGGQGGSGGGGGFNLGNLLSGVSGNLGAYQGGVNAQRSLQAQLAQALAGGRQTQYQDALQQALLKQIQAPQEGAQMARQGDLLANVQDVQANFTPGAGYSFSGGLRPSALGPNARAAGAALSNAGLGIAQGGLQLPATPDLTSGFPSPGGGGNGALNAAGLGTGLLGTLLNGGQSPLNQILNRLMQQGQNQVTQAGGGGDGSTPIGTNPSDIMSQLPGFDPSQYVDPNDWMNEGVG